MRRGRAAALALAAAALLGAAPEAGAQSLVISPPSGAYTTTQGFDVALIVRASASVAGGSATLDGADVTPQLVACVVPGRLTPQGTTFRCPGLTGGVLGPGTHTFDVRIDLADGGQVSQTVTWEVLAVSP
jgi:hypothetical protein